MIVWGGVNSELGFLAAGAGARYDPAANRWAFINPDLTVYFERDPIGPWIALEAVTRLQPDGTWLYVIDNAWGDLAAP